MAKGGSRAGEREGARAEGAESLLIAGGNCEHGTEEQLHLGSVRQGK